MVKIQIDLDYKLSWYLDRYTVEGKFKNKRDAICYILEQYLNDRY